MKIASANEDTIIRLQLSQHRILLDQTHIAERTRGEIKKLTLLTSMSFSQSLRTQRREDFWQRETMRGGERRPIKIKKNQMQSVHANAAKERRMLFSSHELVSGRTNYVPVPVPVPVFVATLSSAQPRCDAKGIVKRKKYILGHFICVIIKRYYTGVSSSSSSFFFFFFFFFTTVFE
jgi:hypothetical protein